MQVIKNYIVGAIGAAFFMALGSLLTHNSISAAPPVRSTAPERLYYLTRSSYTGMGAPNQCATGYHMASFAEMSDLSHLTYNDKLGRTADDDGAGPPSFYQGIGWIRSGNAANGSPTTVGGNASNPNPTNCNLWTSDLETDTGEVAWVNPGMMGTVVQGLNMSSNTVIFSNSITCAGSNPGGTNIVGVWCVAD